MKNNISVNGLWEGYLFSEIRFHIEEIGRAVGSICSLNGSILVVCNISFITDRLEYSKFMISPVLPRSDFLGLAVFIQDSVYVVEVFHKRIIRDNPYRVMPDFTDPKDIVRRVMHPNKGWIEYFSYLDLKG